MFAYVILIIMAWFVQMPLWLSITTTAISGFMIGIKVISLIIDIVKACHEQE